MIVEQRKFENSLDWGETGFGTHMAMCSTKHVSYLRTRLFPNAHSSPDHLKAVLRSYVDIENPDEKQRTNLRSTLV